MCWRKGWNWLERTCCSIRMLSFGMIGLVFNKLEPSGLAKLGICLLQFCTRACSLCVSWTPCWSRLVYLSGSTAKASWIQRSITFYRTQSRRPGSIQASMLSASAKPGFQVCWQGIGVCFLCSRGSTKKVEWANRWPFSNGFQPFQRIE